MTLQCIILDLDGTLIDTSLIQPFRDSGQWSLAYENIPQCNIYPDVQNLVNIAQSTGIKIGIATNSPSTYANKLLRHFNVKVDYLVGYHDVQNHKPAPDCLNKVIEHLRLDSSQVAYLGDSFEDRQCAANANIDFFAVDWADLGSIPADRRGVSSLFKYISESLTQPTGINGAQKVMQRGNHYFLGYYDDPIKKEIWQFKDNKAHAVARWKNYTSSVANELPPVDYIIRALGHAEMQVTQPESALDFLCNQLACALGAKYLPDLIKKTRPLKKSTGLGKTEREAQLKGVYEVDTSCIEQTDLLGKSILIVDDVFTTGATTNEISRAINRVLDGVSVNVFTLVKTLYRNDRESVDQQSSALFYALYQQKVRIEEATPSADVIPFLKPNKVRRRRLKNKSFTANYSNTNHNFVIQNLDTYTIASESVSKSLIGAIYILRNMLQRGTPTTPSRFLRDRFSATECAIPMGGEYQALISRVPINWARQIRGDTAKNHYPARYFYDELLPKYLGDLSFIRQMMVPEIQLYEMTQVYVEGLLNKQVDFFIPQVGLIIEVDGAQHANTQDIDERRDHFTGTQGLKTLRFSSREIYNECEEFKKKMDVLRNRIRSQMALEDGGTLAPSNGLKLSDYQRAYVDSIDVTKPEIALTAVMRFQLLLLELLESGRIRLGVMSKLHLINRDGIDFCMPAVEDLNMMLRHILTLLSQPIKDIEIELTELIDEECLDPQAKLVVDFSICRRYSDEFQDRPGVIFVRTHYFDFYRELEQGSANNTRAEVLQPYDYFEMSCTEPIKYDLDLAPGSKHRESLRYFLSNLFLPFEENVDFREGQVGIIGTALSRKGTIGLLPTGSGKSICYQLSALLQPAISFVVCPIKSLMYDQKADLDSIGITRSGYITSDQSSGEKAATQKAFGRGKFFFVFISPERFQTRAFRSEMRAIGLDLAFAYAVIDEVHCLSEWGHDFRTSYLNLANTITSFAPAASYIGLTATASVNVLKDIQNEFEIPSDNVRTPIDFTRSELRFDVVDDQGSKSDNLISLVDELNRKWNQKSQDPQGRAGIVFTSTVNGANGCYELASKLATTLDFDVRYYAGSAPKKSRLQTENFNNYKRKVQDDFKNDRFDLLTATKAFGMGVNKGNIAYTIHYGIPGSMEALYQEAGRAGRNKKLFSDVPADCYVLLSREPNNTVLDKIWDSKVTVAQLKELQNDLSRGSDVRTNLWLMTNNLESINDDFKLMHSVYLYLTLDSSETVKVIDANQFGTQKFKLEKAVYRLFQLGIVKDWIIEDFFRGELEVEMEHLCEEQICENLERTIGKYESDFTIHDIYTSNSDFYTLICSRRQSGQLSQVEFYFLILLIWSYDHFVYNRRQSLKTVYEHCGDLASGLISNDAFKNRIEGYFKFNESSQIFMHLAENTSDIGSWFTVFFEEDEFANQTALISKEKAIGLKDQLARFLESYKDNPSLNYISGILRLIADQFEDADGERRMASALERISSYELGEIETLVRSTVQLAPLLSEGGRAQFSEIFFKYIPNEDLLEIINEGFGDEYSYKVLLGPLEERLSAVINKFKETDWCLTSNN